MHPTPHHPFSPPHGMRYEALNLDEMIAITAKLTAILTQESDLLGRMRLQELSPLQEEKQRLGDQLVAFQKRLAADQGALLSVDDATRDTLISKTVDLHHAIEEDMQRTLLAQRVNRQVLQVFVDAVADQERVGAYGAQGNANAGPDITVSLTLNERA